MENAKQQKRNTKPSKRIGQLQEVFERGLQEKMRLQKL